jgi:hypothetical protein
MYKDYVQLRNQGFTHDDTLGLIDKSERQMYRYKKRYREDYGVEQPEPVIISEHSEYLDRNLMRFSKNKIELQSLRNEISTHTREMGRLEVFNEELTREIKEYLENKESDVYELQNFNLDDEDYVMYTLSDSHVGSIIELEHNEYNIDIAESRFEELTQYIINDIQHNKYERVGLGIFGDNVEGSNLRISQLLKISELLPGQTITVIDIFEKMIRTIAEYAEVDVYFILYDNHGRLSLVTSNKDNVPDNNMNIVISNMLLRLLKDVDNINWYIGDELTVKINDLNIYMNHGHEFRTPNINNYKKLFNLRNQMDFYIHGHFHNFKYISMNDMYVDRAAISLPSMCGPDDYSMSIGASNKAAAIKLSFNEDGVSGIKKITFTD